MIVVLKICILFMQNCSLKIGRNFYTEYLFVKQ